MDITNESKSKSKSTHPERLKEMYDILKTKLERESAYTGCEALIQKMIEISVLLREFEDD
jgi:hypothetical protein